MTARDRLPGRVCRARVDRHHWGPFAPEPLPTHVPIAAEFAYRFTVPASTRPELLRHGAHARGVLRARRSGATRRASPFHVTSADWQESDRVLAGIYQRFRLFERRGRRDRRTRRVRRRDDRSVPPRASKALFNWRRPSRVGHDWGAGSGRIVTRTTTSRSATASSRRRLGDPHRRSVFARRAEAGRPRRDRRPLQRHGARSRKPAPRVSDRRVAAVGPPVRRVPPEGRAGTDWRRRHDGSTTASRRADSERHRLSPFRRHGNTAGRHQHREDDRHGHRCSVRWMGRQLFVQRGWTPYSGGSSRRVLPSPRRQLSGLIELTAAGSGTFDVPRNDFRFRINDLVVGQEPVGLVAGKLALRERS